MADFNAHMNQSGSPRIVWYDGNAYKPESEITRQSLEGTLGDVLIMNDKEEWQRLIKRDHSIQRLVLIISGTFGREIVPKLHHANNILSIYIYCQNKEANEAWVKEYSKVKSVHTNLDELVSQILSDLENN